MEQMVLPNIQSMLIAFAAINVATYALFWYDKYCAKRGHWRVSEAALLGFALLGGSPAAFLAMRKFRHKTKKTSFRMRYWLIVIVQVGALLYFFRHMFQANA